MWYSMACGCEVEVDTYIDYGCCELCGESIAIDNVTFVSNCEAHTGVDTTV